MSIGFSFRYGMIIAAVAIISLTALVFAQIAQQVIFTFVNGASPVSDITLFVFFPERIQPVNLSSGMVWNLGTRTLTVALNQVASYQKLSLPISIVGPSGTYQIPGKLRGQWTQIGQNFESDLITVETTLRGTGAVSVVQSIRSNPQVVAVAKNIAVPLAVTLEVAGASALVSSAITANASLAVHIAEALRFLQFLGLGSFRIRRHKPWGKVFNRLTGRAIKNATVRVFEVTFQKLKDTQFTDANGRFGFLISPGSYYLVIAKEGFQDVKTEALNVKGGEEAFNVEVALIPESGAIAVAKPLVKFLNSLIKIINILNPWILALGTLASVGILVILPTIFNAIVLLVYAGLDIAKFLLSKKILKSFGRVIDKLNQQPLALVVVRIFDADKNWLLTSRVTDPYGRFKFLVTPGNYYITCAKEGYKAYASQPLEVTKASLVSWDITLEPGV